MAKRIYTLAKELGVDSKTIVAKCQAEGLGNTVKNHMSTLSAGLEATIREWFSEAEVAHTAVEQAQKVDVAAAKRKASKKRKKRKPATKKPKEEEVRVEVVAEAPEAQAAPVETQVQVAEAAPPAAPAKEEAPAEPKIKGPVKVKTAAKAKIVPSPKHVPEPPKLQGPKVIRVETAERVRPIGPRTRVSRPAKSPASSIPVAETPSDIKPPVQSRRRRGAGAVGEEEEKRPRRRLSRRHGGRLTDVGEKLREWRDRDLLERTERLAQASGQLLRGRQTEIRDRTIPGTLPRTGKITVKEPITVKDLSAAIGIKGADIITKLMGQGIMSSLNATIQNWFYQRSAPAKSSNNGEIYDVKQDDTRGDEKYSAAK